MDWECTHNGEKEKDLPRTIDVCHHCGKPVCQTHSTVIADDAFDPRSGASRSAVHCTDCKNTYHPRASDVGRQQQGVMGAAPR